MKDVWTSDWKRVRSALLRVRQAVDVRRAGDLDRESFALRGVAAHETFATLETDVDAERRGRLIVTYVAGLVRKSFSEYPDHDQRGADVLRDWLRIVTEGVTARALAAQTTGRVADPQEVHRAEQRIEDRLWLGGNRQSSASRAAIHALYTTVTGGMHARLDAGGQAALVGESVTWEWDGLTQRHDHAARALLSVLALRAQYVVASRPPCRSLCRHPVGKPLLRTTVPRRIASAYIWVLSPEQPDAAGPLAGRFLTPADRPGVRTATRSCS